MDAQPAWITRLKIRHLEVFTTLVETGNQSTTAQRLHVTQPALSKWLRELEQNVGSPLFDRGRPLKLTVQGEVVLRFAQRVLGDSVSTVAELTSLRTGRSGHLRVGVLRTVAAILLPKVIVRYRRAAPRVQLTIHEESLDVLLPQLQRRELDCIIGRLQPEALNAAVISEALYDEPVCAVVRREHPLLARKRLTWRDVGDYPWILPLPGTPLRMRVDAEFAAAGLRIPSDPIESISLLTNEKLLQETDMVSVVSRQLAVHYASSGSLSILPLEMRRALGPVGLLWNDANPTAALREFLDAVRTEAKEWIAERGSSPKKEAATSRSQVPPRKRRLRQRSRGFGRVVQRR